MRTPTIHMNGTGKRMLEEGYNAAYQAVDAAIDAICNVEFNARDYYPQGPEAWGEARDEQNDRLKKLRDVMIDLETILIAIGEAK
jgi:hypothetical protein